MTSPIPMTREELLELAALDAYGLLDAYESALYTRSFHHAPAAVQDEVLRLQADIAVCDIVDSGEEIEPALRERVLAAVARAIEKEASGLGPLASIGRPRAAESRHGLGRVAGGRTAMFWRAAAFVMMATAVVMAYFWTDAQQRTIEIAEIVLGNETEKDINELIGPGFREFAENPNVRSVALGPTSAGSGSVALVYFNELTDESLIIAFNLTAANGPATLEIEREDGTFEPLGTLTSRGFCSILRLDESLSRGILTASLRITSGEEVLLRSV